MLNIKQEYYKINCMFAHSLNRTDSPHTLVSKISSQEATIIINKYHTYIYRINQVDPSMGCIKQKIDEQQKCRGKVVNGIRLLNNTATVNEKERKKQAPIQKDYVLKAYKMNASLHTKKCFQICVVSPSLVFIYFYFKLEYAENTLCISINYTLNVRKNKYQI